MSETEFMRIPHYWISSTNSDLIRYFNNLEDALQSLKDKYNEGFKDYGVVKHRNHYELRKYHPQPYNKTRGHQKANERSKRTLSIGNIKLYYHPKDEEERQAIKEEIGLFTVNKNYTGAKIGHHITWLYIGF